MSLPTLPINEKLETECNETFNCVVINSDSNVDSVDWRDLEYSKKIIEISVPQYIKFVDVTSEKFIQVMSESLDVSKYNIEGLPIKTEIIAEMYPSIKSNTYKPSYVYQMAYVDFSNHKEFMVDSNMNALATLFSINGDIIYSNAVIFKNRIESQSDSMTMNIVTKQDLQDILYSKVHTTIVTWDETWKEEPVVGDLNEYANRFFDDEKIYKVELAFLKYNINIWYILMDGGKMTLLGNLLKRPIEKCIIFTMRNDEYRGTISLDEVTKIIALSKVLPNFNVPSEYMEEKNDHLRRKIVWNKYKLLDRLYYSKCELENNNK